MVSIVPMPDCLAIYTDCTVWSEICWTDSIALATIATTLMRLQST